MIGLQLSDADRGLSSCSPWVLQEDSKITLLYGKWKFPTHVYLYYDPTGSSTPFYIIRARFESLVVVKIKVTLYLLYAHWIKPHISCGASAVFFEMVWTVSLCLNRFNFVSMGLWVYDAKLISNDHEQFWPDARAALVLLTTATAVQLPPFPDVVDARRVYCSSRTKVVPD